MCGPDRQRRVELDGLRGIAILLVIFLHWIVRPYKSGLEEYPFLYEILNYSVHGVDIFLVISGFLIGQIFLAHHARPGFIRSFYIRRFFRIIPLYFTVLTILVLLRHAFTGIPGDAPPVASYFLFINNLYTASGFQALPELGPMWSLAIEEQFYLSGALVAAMSGRRGILILAVVFVSSGTLYRFANWLTPLGWSSWDFTLAHVDPLGFGLLAAWLLSSPHRARVLSWVSAWGRPTLFILFAVLALTAESTVAAKLGAGILLVSLVTVLVVLAQEQRPGRVLRNPVLAAYGKMCFSLYVLHEAVKLYGTALAGGEYTLPLVLLLFAFLSALCWFLWLRVETPLIAVGRRWSYDGSVARPRPLAG